MSIPNYPKCNLTVNGEEYYTSIGDKLGSLFIGLPLILGSILCTCVLSIIFGGVGYNTYKTTKKYTFGVILLIILTICCFSSFISNIGNYYNTKKKITSPDIKDDRPCFSQNSGKLIVDN